MSFDPVGIAEIADRLGKKRQTVALWNMRDLLPPAEGTVSGAPCWNWSTIKKWAKETGRIK